MNRTERIAAPLLKGQPFLIRYHSRSRDEAALRVVHPQRPIRYRSNW